MRVKYNQHVHAAWFVDWLECYGSLSPAIQGTCIPVWVVAFMVLPVAGLSILQPTSGDTLAGESTGHSRSLQVKLSIDFARILWLPSPLLLVTVELN